MKLRLVVTTLAVALVASAALAQGAGPPQRGQGGQGAAMGQRMGGGGAAMLVRRPDVQTELKLSDSQKQQLQQKLDALAPPRGGGAGGAGGGQGQRGQGGQMGQGMQQMDQQATAAIKEVLNADQFKRFTELRYQFEGARSFGRPEVAQELGLTEQQQRQIQQIQREAMEAQRANMGAGGGDRAAMMEQMQRAQEETNRKILAVLTDSQRAKWTQMQGATFRFQMGRGGQR